MSFIIGFVLFFAIGAGLSAILRAAGITSSSAQGLTQHQLRDIELYAYTAYQRGYSEGYWVAKNEDSHLSHE